MMRSSALPYRAILRLTLLTLAFAIGTGAVGWWTIPVVALVSGVVTRRTKHPGLTAAVAGAAAWGALLEWSALHGAPIGASAHRLAAVAQLPPLALLLVTLTFPALLAGSAATLAAECVQLVLPDRRHVREEGVR